MNRTPFFEDERWRPKASEVSVVFIAITLFFILELFLWISRVFHRITEAARSLLFVGSTFSLIVSVFGAIASLLDVVVDLLACIISRVINLPGDVNNSYRNEHYTWNFGSRTLKNIARRCGLRYLTPVCFPWLLSSVGIIACMNHFFEIFCSNINEK